MYDRSSSMDSQDSLDEVFDTVFCQQQQQHHHHQQQQHQQQQQYWRQSKARQEKASFCL
jgi:hypothetical protein